MGEANPPLLDRDRPRGAGSSGASPVAAVSMRKITKRFPGVLANDRVDFEAAVGEVHALLGENGAGKTTLLNILTGLYRPDEGEIELYGEPVRFRSPRDALAAGVGMVHQHFRLVAPFTVAENVLLGDHRADGRSFVVHPRAVEQSVAELGERYGLAIDPKARIWQLSVGEQQRVEIVKAVYREARILILDEPTAVLTPQEAAELVRDLARDGRGGKDRPLHHAQAERGDGGRGPGHGAAEWANVATVATAETTPRSLAGLMVGRDIDEVRRVERASPIGDVVLEVEGLTARGDRGGRALDDVSFEISAGEIVAVAGVAGNGQRELAEVVYGIREADTGTVRVLGEALRPGDPRSAIAAGVAHVPEDRLGTGLAPSLTVTANTVLKTYRSPPASRGPLLLVGRMRALAVDLIDRYDVKTPGPDVPVRNLSGGNLQKLVLGREFGGKPRVLVAAQPTRGLDVGAIETVHGYLREAAASGVAVLLISEDLDEIRALADRVLVMYEGAVVGELDAATATVEEIGYLMAGGRR